MIRPVEIALVCCAMVLCGAGGLVAARNQSVFHADAGLVVVPVSVHDQRGQLVPDLDRNAFEVYENDVRQTLAVFLREDTPVSLGIVLDNSGSMRTMRTTVETAALAFARSSNPLDEIFVVNFADTTHIGVSMTRDMQVLESGIHRMDAVGGTALRDAVRVAVDYVQTHGTRELQALLVISDGDDNASTESPGHLRAELEGAGVAVYALALPHADPSAAKRGGAALADLSEHTGGLTIRLERLTDIGAAALGLAHEIRRQYTLAYTPSTPAYGNTYRRIRVVVRGQDRLSVRARAGYYPRAAVRD